MLTLQEVIDRKAQLTRLYSTLTGRWVKDEKFYTGEFEIVRPKNVHPIYPATGRNAVDVPANHIITDKPVVRRRRDVHTETEQKRDDLVEDFCLAVLESMEQNAVTPPLHEVVRFQLLRGMGVLLGPFWHGDKWKNNEDGWIWFDSEDPAVCLIPPGPSPREIFLTYEMTIDEAEQLAEENPHFAEFKRNERALDEKIKLNERYWMGKKDVLCQYASWEEGKGDWLQKPKDTIYRYLPFERVYSGYGLRSRTAKIEAIAESILNSQVKTLLEGEAQAFTKMDSYMANVVWDRWEAPTQEMANLTTILPEPHSVSVIPTGVNKIQQEQMPNTILEYVGTVQAALSEALFSGVVQGQRPKGVYTTSGLALLTGSARLKFGPPLRLLEAALCRTMAKVGILIDDLSEYLEEPEFELRGHPIRRTDWSGDYAVKVQLMAEDPEDQRMRVVQGLQILAQQAMSEEKVHQDYFGNEDYWTDFKKRLKERLLKSDAAELLLEQGLGMVTQQAKTQGNSTATSIGVDALAMMNRQAQMMRAARSAEMTSPAAQGSPEQSAGAVRVGMQRGYGQ